MMAIFHHFFNTQLNLFFNLNFTKMLNKILKITAAAAFMVALAINIDMTLNDPFAGMSAEAIATGTTGGDETGEPICAAGGCYATSCSYSGTITVYGSGVAVSNSITCEGTWACCHLTAYCFNKNRCAPL